MISTIQRTVSRKLRQRALLLVAIAALALPVHAVASAQVPLKGKDSGSFTLTPDGCGPGVSTVVIDDAGQATHLGAYAYHANECFNGSTLQFKGTFAMTAANGDAITGSYTGVLTNIVGDLGFYEQDNVITGGTGRFAGASGQFHLSGIANVATLESSQQISGTVSSPGSKG